MARTTPDWRQAPPPEEAARFRSTYRRRRRITVGGMVLLFALWIAVITLQPRKEIIIAVWAAIGIYGLITGFVVWRCPRCGYRFWRQWRVERCPHCWLELEL